jgi:hypothetical protein
MVRIYTEVSDLVPNRSYVTDWIDEAESNVYLKTLRAQSDLEYRLETEFWSIEARPLVRGFWIDHPGAEEYDGRLISNYECSECHEWSRYTTEFCPHCGCEMDI